MLPSLLNSLQHNTVQLSKPANSLESSVQQTHYLNMPLTKYKAAAVTSEPCWFDLEGGVQKTIAFIKEAAKAGCKLIAFPEVWIPGYPYWMWKVTYQQSLPMLKSYRENSLVIDSEEFKRIRRAARDNQMYVVDTDFVLISSTNIN